MDDHDRSNSRPDYDVPSSCFVCIRFLPHREQGPERTTASLMYAVLEVWHFMRWIVRDFGVFLYGCAFACKYIVLRRDAHQRPRKQGHRYSARLRPLLVVPRH